MPGTGQGIRLAGVASCLIQIEAILLFLQRSTSKRWYGGVREGQELSLFAC